MHPLHETQQRRSVLLGRRLDRKCTGEQVQQRVSALGRTRTRVGTECQQPMAQRQIGDERRLMQQRPATIVNRQRTGALDGIENASAIALRQRRDRRRRVRNDARPAQLGVIVGRQLRAVRVVDERGVLDDDAACGASNVYSVI